MNKSLIILSIFFIPMASIIPIYGTIIWYPQLLALMSVCLILIAFRFWDMNKFISIFLIYLVFSYIFVCHQSPRTMLCLICGFGGIFLAHTVSKFTDMRPISCALIAMGVIDTVYVIFQFFGIDPFFVCTTRSHYDAIVGFMGSHNQLGIYHAAINSILLSLSPSLCIFSLVPIFLSKCSSAIGGAFIGTAVYFFYSNKKKWAAITFVVLLLSIPILIKTKDCLVSELGERFKVWGLTISQTVTGKAIGDINGVSRVFTANPLFGYGLGSFFVISPITQFVIKNPKQLNTPNDHRFEHAHNDLVEAFFEFGYIGLILIMFCVSKIINDFLSSQKTFGVVTSFSSLVAMSICSLGVYVFHAPVSLFIFCLMLGIFYGEIGYAKQRQVV